MTTTPEHPVAEESPFRTLVALAIPAIIIGIASALVLWGVDQLSEGLKDVVWGSLPAVFGASEDTWWWILIVLTLTGLAVGLVIRFFPGHGGPDSATTELVEPPVKLSTLPGLLLVVVLALAGGVSLGPENPIIAVNVALVAAVLARLMPKVPTQLAIMLGASATVGALFGTPVAAALIFTGVVASAKAGGALWDRLFLPVAAAGAASVTMSLLGAPALTFGLPASRPLTALDFVTGTIVAAVGVAVSLIGLYAFPHVHRLFRRLRNPILISAVGGLVLGVLGVIGGPITLFKGLDQAGELLANIDTYSVGTLVVIVLVKIVALVVSASAAFRGGRIFPAVFIGFAIGAIAYMVIPDMPLGFAAACGVLGVVLVVARDGWMALFVAVVAASDVAILPMLCVIMLPAWLMVTRLPEFRIAPVLIPPARIS